MNSRYPTRTKIADKVFPTDSNRTAITALELPEDLRALLYMEKDLICIQYAHLEQYFETPDCVFPPADDQPPRKDKPSIFIDIASHTSVKPALPLINILPYIRLYLTLKHIRFHFLTENDHQGQGFMDLASTVLHRHAHNWRKFVLESGNVKEVRVWWKGRCIDVVLKRGLDWAVHWDFHVENSAEVVMLKSLLGLVALKPMQWDGMVVVESLEA